MINNSLGDKLIDTLVSEKIARGLKTTEEMLKVNTHLIAFGKLKKASESYDLLTSGSTQTYNLSEPSDDQLSFIVTSLSKSALIDRLKSDTKFLKICLILFGSIGAILHISRILPSSTSLKFFLRISTLFFF